MRSLPRKLFRVGKLGSFRENRVEGRIMETLSSLDLTRPDYSRQSEYGPYTPCAFHERSVDSEENQKRVLKQTERHFKNQSAKPEACMLPRGGSNPKRRQSLTNPHAEQQYVALLWPALCLYFAPLHPKAQPPPVHLPRHHDAGKMIDTHELPLAHQLPRSLHPLLGLWYSCVPAVQNLAPEY